MDFINFTICAICQKITDLIPQIFIDLIVLINVMIDLFFDFIGLVVSLLVLLFWSALIDQFC